MKQFMIDSKRINALLMATIMIVIVLFFSFFIATETHHDCTGEDCPICACVSQCEETIRQVGSGVVIQTTIIEYVVVTILIAFGFINSLHAITPITTKVRLND